MGGGSGSPRLQWQRCHSCPSLALGALATDTGRGAVSLERLAEDAHGDLVYPCARPWSDGALGITLSPVACLEKLAALVPLPRLRQRRCALEMARGPLCQRGALRLLAPITPGAVRSQSLRPLQHAADPSPIAPARARQEACAWGASTTHGVARGLISAVRAVEVCLPPLHATRGQDIYVVQEQLK